MHLLERYQHSDGVEDAKCGCGKRWTSVHVIGSPEREAMFKHKREFPGATLRGDPRR